MSHPLLAAVATSFPPTVVDAAQTQEVLCSLFPQEEEEFIRGLIHNSGVLRRQTALPPEELLALEDFTERNRSYSRIALEHALNAAGKALEQAGISAQEVDAILDVSCTGICIPALDVHLSRELGFRPDVLRIPIGEAGCAAGALAMGVARQLAANGKVVLIVAVEMCTLSFIRGDIQRANLIASILFGDGAAAAVVLPTGGSLPRLLASGTYLFPKTEHAMGFDIGTHGLRLVLDRTLPVLLRKHLRQVVTSFLAEHGYTLEQVGLHLVHTGGRRILDIYQEIMELPEGEPRASRSALAEHGNISSVSILMVLEEAMRQQHHAPQDGLTLAVAFGPGLSVEMFLMDRF